MARKRWATEEARKHEYERQSAYFKEERKQVKLAMAKEQAAQLTVFCEVAGIPVQTFIKDCIAQVINNHGGRFDWEIKGIDSIKLTGEQLQEIEKRLQETAEAGGE